MTDVPTPLRNRLAAALHEAANLAEYNLSERMASVHGGPSNASYLDAGDMILGASAMASLRDDLALAGHERHGEILVTNGELGLALTEALVDGDRLAEQLKRVRDAADSYTAAAGAASEGVWLERALVDAAEVLASWEQRREARANAQLPAAEAIERALTALAPAIGGDLYVQGPKYRIGLSRAIAEELGRQAVALSAVGGSDG